MPPLGPAPHDDTPPSPHPVPYDRAGHFLALGVAAAGDRGTGLAIRRDGDVEAGLLLATLDVDERVRVGVTVGERALELKDRK